MVSICWVAGEGWACPAKNVRQCPLWRRGRVCGRQGIAPMATQGRKEGGEAPDPEPDVRCRRGVEQVEYVSHVPLEEVAAHAVVVLEVGDARLDGHPPAEALALRPRLGLGLPMRGGEGTCTFVVPSTLRPL